MSALDTSLATMRRLPAGHVIFKEGDMGDCAYVVRGGTVDISRMTANGSTFLASIEVGEVFGEVALMTDQPRMATAVARTDVVLELVDRAGMVHLFSSSPSLAYDIVRRLAGVATTQQVNLLSAQPSPNQNAEDEEDEEDDAEPKPWRQRLERLLLGKPRPQAEDQGFVPDYLLILSESPPAITRLSAWAILTLIIGSLIWATLAQVDVVVNGKGKLTSVVPPVAIQPSSGGTIRALSVRNGQMVRKGDSIAVLDGTASEADLRSTRSDLRAVEATVTRLQAELSDIRPARFAESAEENDVQSHLFDSRRQKLASALIGRDTEIQSLISQVAREREEMAVLTRQISQQDQVTAIRKSFFEREKELFRREGSNQIQYLEAEQRRLSLEHEQVTARKHVAALASQLDGKKAERESYVNEFKAATNEALANSLRERSRLVEQLKKMELANSLVTLTAPYDAVVFNVADKTVGSYFSAGETLASLVAVDAGLELTVDIDPKDIAFVTRGDPVMIKFDALPFSKHGMANGTLQVISDGTFQEKLSGERQATFRGRVSVDEVHLTDVSPDFRLIPGMTAAADIRVGKRRVISYFFYPVVRALSSSIRER